MTFINMLWRLSGKFVIISIILIAVQCPKNPGQEEGFISKQVKKERFIDANGRVVTKIITIIKDKNGVRQEEQIIEADVPLDKQFDFRNREIKKPVEVQVDPKIQKPIETKVQKPVENKLDSEPVMIDMKQLMQRIQHPGQPSESSNPISNFLWSYLKPVRLDETVILGPLESESKEKIPIIAEKQEKIPVIQTKKEHGPAKEIKQEKNDSLDSGKTASECGRAVFEAVNNFRAKHGKNKVDWSDEIYKSIENHTKDMAKTGRLSHDGFEYRFTEINKDFVPLKIRIVKPAENVAMIGGSAEYQPKIVSDIIEMWRQSSGHNANMQLQNASYAAADCRYSTAKKSWYATLLIAEVVKSFIIL